MYHTEGTDIVIDGWENGIADSPFEGFAELSYGSIMNVPGEFAAQFPLVASTVDTTGGVAMGIAIQIATEYSAGAVVRYYMLDSKGQIFNSATSGNLVTWTYRAQVGASPVTSTFGNSGIVVWKGYVLVFRADAVYYAPVGTTLSFTDWSKTITAGCTHYVIAGSDDAVYFCNGTTLGSILENAGSTFIPATASTFTFNASSLQLPSNDNSTCLAELQASLLIGGALNRIYNWDRKNVGPNSIIYLPERYVMRMVTVNTNTYVFVSNVWFLSGRGNIYVTNGTQVDPFKKIPDAFTNTVSTTTTGIYQEPYWVFYDAMYHRNMLVFTTIGINNNGVFDSSIPNTAGIWAINLGTNALFRLNSFPNSESEIGTVLSPNYQGLTVNGLGYITGGNGLMANTTTALTGVAEFITDKIPIGTFLGKTTLVNLEIKLTDILGASDSISLSYITDTNTSGAIGTVTSADGIGAVFPVPFQGSQWLQIQGSLTPGGTSTFCRIREIRLRRQ